MGQKLYKPIKDKKKDPLMLHAPQIKWGQNLIEYWIPTVFIGNISMPMNPRKFRGFHKGERRHIMAIIQMSLSEVLFGESTIITNGKTMANNPNFDLLPFYAEDSEGGFHQINPNPFEEEAQKEAANEIIIP